MGKPDTAGAFKSFDFYQAMFEGADLYMSFWQPMLKGIGRAQLEFAQLAAKSGQSTLQYMTHLSACRSPADVMSANLKYFETLTAHHRDSVDKLTAAMAKAAEPPPVFNVLQMPAPRSTHDILLLPVDEHETSQQGHRKVA
jgi:hypothetical protein